MRSVSTRFRGGRSSKLSWNRKSKRCWNSRRIDHGHRDAATASHEKRFSNRPGSALVPRLRRLRNSLRGASSFPRTRHQEREFRYRLRHRLFQPFSVLHEHLWLSHDSRPRTGSGDRTKSDSSGPGSLGDRKSTRLNSSHRCISYAVFCLKKKIKYTNIL